MVYVEYNLHSSRSLILHHNLLVDRHFDLEYFLTAQLSVCLRVHPYLQGVTAIISYPCSYLLLPHKKMVCSFCCLQGEKRRKEREKERKKESQKMSGSQGGCAKE